MSSVPDGATLPANQEEAPYPRSIERALGPIVAGEPTQPELFHRAAALCPIGIFDSGMGGLSVVAEIRRLLPAEDIVYFADSGNCPYGGRPDEWLRSRALEITDFLLEHGAKVVVVACNAASAAGLEHVRARHSTPIVGLVPAVKPAVEATRTGTVGVLATEATMRGRLLADVIERFAGPAEVRVVSTAPRGLVEAVERGDVEAPETEAVVRQAVGPMLESGADAIVLGCTHYPFLRPLIRRVAGEQVQIIDSGMGVARQTRRVLEARNLLRHGEHRGQIAIYTSGDPATVGNVVRQLLGEEIPVYAAGI